MLELLIELVEVAFSSLHQGLENLLARRVRPAPHSCAAVVEIRALLLHGPASVQDGGRVRMLDTGQLAVISLRPSETESARQASPRAPISVIAVFLESPGSVRTPSSSENADVLCGAGGKLVPNRLVKQLDAAL